MQPLIKNYQELININSWINIEPIGIFLYKLYKFTLSLTNIEGKVTRYGEIPQNTTSTITESIEIVKSIF